MVEDDPTERHAHYLHQPRLLEALFAPPVSEPRLLSWSEDGALWLASRNGGIHRVDPEGGTRKMWEGPADPCAMVVTPDRMLLATRDGVLSGWRGGQKQWEQPSELLAQVAAAAWRDGWVITGDTANGTRMVLLLSPDGQPQLRQLLPPRTVVGARSDGSLYVARSLSSGIFLRDFGHPLPEDPPTSHVLRCLEGGRLLGLASGGVLFWDGESHTIQLQNVVHAAWGPGDKVALGRRNGSVVASRLIPHPPRREVSGHQHPILGIGYARNGQFLATTAADGCRVWSVG